MQQNCKKEDEPKPSAIFEISLLCRIEKHEVKIITSDRRKRKEETRKWEAAKGKPTAIEKWEKSQDWTESTENRKENPKILL